MTQPHDYRPDGPLRICKLCHAAKPITSYYQTGAYYRRECKACTTANNVIRNRETQNWKTRYGNDDIRKEKNREYYAANKAKFKEYRAAFKQRQSDQWRKDKS